MAANDAHPSCEMSPKELSSTLSRGTFYLVKRQLETASQCWSPARYPESAQAQPVCPTAQNLLSTPPVDNPLFRQAAAAYGYPR